MLGRSFDVRHRIVAAIAVMMLALGWYAYGYRAYGELWLAVGPPVDDPIAYRAIVVLLGAAAWISGSWRFALAAFAIVIGGLYVLGPGSGDAVAEGMAPDLTRAAMWVALALTCGVALDRVCRRIAA